MVLLKQIGVETLIGDDFYRHILPLSFKENAHLEIHQFNLFLLLCHENLDELLDLDIFIQTICNCLKSEVGVRNISNIPSLFSHADLSKIPIGLFIESNPVAAVGIDDHLRLHLAEENFLDMWNGVAIVIQTTLHRKPHANYIKENFTFLNHLESLLIVTSLHHDEISDPQQFSDGLLIFIECSLCGQNQFKATLEKLILLVILFISLRQIVFSHIYQLFQSQRRIDKERGLYVCKSR